MCFFYYTGSIEMFGLVDSAAWWMVLLQAVLMILMIPLPSSMDIRGWGEVTSINNPVWSLMFEYVANILYALIFRRLGTLALGILVAATAVFTADCCLHLNLFGLLVSDSCAYSVVGGYFLNPEHLYIGYTRLLYPFLMGLLLARIGLKIKVKGGFALTSFIVFALLCVPTLGGDNRLIDGAFQMTSILFLFPLILLIGAGSELKGKNTSKLCIFFGQISFPLYITHFPLICVHTSWAQRHLDAEIRLVNARINQLLAFYQLKFISGTLNK